MRVVVTTAHRRLDPARLVDGTVRCSGIVGVAQAIAGSDAAPNRIEQASNIAGRFIEMVFSSAVRGLVGDDREHMDAAAARRIDDAIDLLSYPALLHASDAS
jgi:hypothetical protein